MAQYTPPLGLKADAALTLLVEETGKNASTIVDELIAKANFDKLPVEPRPAVKTRCYSLFGEHLETLEKLAQQYGRNKTEIVEAIIETECA